MVHLATPHIPGVYVPFAHHDCVHNQLVSIHNRVCGAVPQPTPAGLDLMRQGVRILSRSIPKTTQEEIGAFYQHYSGPKRARYERARRALLDEGVVKKDAGVTAFIKCEKTSPIKRNPDPRAIQFRDAKYCVALASFLKPIEPHLYNVRATTKYLRGHTRLVGKGLNQVQRAALLRRKMEQFCRPVVLSLDMSRFDQHVSREALEIEHSLYLQSNSDPWFRTLLSYQLDNLVRTRLGYRYRTRGKRMSGDMNTALGNCVLMLAMIMGCFETVFKVVYDILDDGDDCLLIIEEDQLSRVLAELPALVLTMGHELKIENIARTLEDVEWCQSKPVFDGERWKFVRNPFKVMSCCLVGTRWYRQPPRVRREFLAGLAICEASLNAGVPVLQEYAKALARNSHGATARFDTNSGEWWRYVREMRVRKTDIITDESRLSFAQAFGISVEDQHHYEATLSQWNFSVSSDVVSSESWNPESWINERTQYPEFQEGYIPQT